MDLDRAPHLALDFFCLEAMVKLALQIVRGSKSAPPIVMLNSLLTASPEAKYAEVYPALEAQLLVRWPKRT